MGRIYEYGDISFCKEDFIGRPTDLNGFGFGNTDVQPILTYKNGNGTQISTVKVKNQKIFQELIGRTIVFSPASEAKNPKKLVGGIVPFQNYECTTVKFLDYL